MVICRYSSVVNDALNALCSSFGLFDESYTCPVAHEWWHPRCFPPLARDAFAALKDASSAEEVKMHRASPHSWTACGCSCFVWQQLKWLAGEAVKVGAGKEWWRAVRCVFCWFRFVAVANIWWFILHNWTSRWIRLHGDLSAMQIDQNGSWNFWNLCFSFTDLDIFFSHWNDILHEEWSKETTTKKNHSLYVTLKARAKRKGKSVVQQVSNLVCFFLSEWAIIAYLCACFVYK